MAHRMVGFLFGRSCHEAPGLRLSDGSRLCLPWCIERIRVFVMGPLTPDHSRSNISACSCVEDAQNHDDFRRLLDDAAKLVCSLGPQFTGDCKRLLSLAERLQEGRFHLAVLGQFKRGKSTLLNAFLGESLLPTSVVPLTAIPTFLQYGPELLVRVCYQDDRPAEEFRK